MTNLRILVATSLFFLPVAILGQTIPMPAKQLNQQASQDAMVSEIDQIRKRLGGGVSAQLSDLEFGDQSPDDEFRHRLEELSRQAYNDPTPRRPVTTARVETEMDSGRVGALRNAARQLEILAAEFEETGMFQEADQMRSQAGHFWQKARGNQAIRSPQYGMPGPPKAKEMPSASLPTVPLPNAIPQARIDEPRELP